MFDMQTCNHFSLIQVLRAIYQYILYNHTVFPSSLTWWITLNDWMVVHLESGIATAACEAHNMVLAVVYYDSRLIDGDVICPYIEDNTNFPLILQVKNKY